MPTDFAPTGLRCNCLVSPLAIRAGSPSFSSTSAAPGALERQQSYQVLVATDEQRLTQDVGTCGTAVSEMGQPAATCCTKDIQSSHSVGTSGRSASGPTPGNRPHGAHPPYSRLESAEPRHGLRRGFPGTNMLWHFPSWRYPIRQGATTMWERWDGWTEARGFQSPHMNSFNHYALGSVGEWLFRYMA